MDFWFIWIAVAITIANILYLLVKRGKNLPPGPPQLPIVGSLPFMGKDQDVRKVFSKLQAKYGSIWMAWLGATPVVVLAGYDVIYEALVKKGAIFSGRPDTLLFTDILGTQGISTSSSTKNHDFALGVLNKLGFARHSMESTIIKEVKQLLAQLEKLQTNPVDPAMLLRKTTLNIISRFVFNRRWDYTDSGSDGLIKLMDEFALSVGSDSLINVFPYLRFLPGDLIGYHKVLHTKERLFAEYRTMIDNQKKIMKPGQKPTNYVEVYLTKMDNPDGKSGEFSDGQLVMQVQELMETGTETSSSVLTWALLYMALDPHIQDKVHKEIDEVLGNQLLSSDHRSLMPYTEACLSEVQRISSVIPLGLPHANLSTTTLAGYTIPTGTMILTNLYAVHMDPETWPDPQHFDPERFLREDGTYKTSKKLIPFSLGKRACLGEVLARMELFFIFTSILQKFTIRFSECRQKPTTEGILGITFNPKPYDIIFLSRFDDFE